ncbi:MAG: hypothetical protein C0404_01860 [Verrucomicrobia bacterium]|nr:hypothetical protein [Verrucomicrobiota bacterium]
MAFCSVMLVSYWLQNRVLAVDAPTTDGKPIDALSAMLLRQARGDSGLCVHIGCGDGSLTAALAGGDRFLVHGLDRDRARIDRARLHIQSLGLYGTASVEYWTTNRLPYADNLVNLVVISDLTRVMQQGLSLKEVMRVLCPQGTAVVGQRDSGKPNSLTEDKLKAILKEAGITEFSIVAEFGIWAKIGKPRPPDMDEWTHFRHGPEGSGVSSDGMGPLACVRWVAGPSDGIVGCNALVSGQGRNLYVVDGGYASYFLRATNGASKYLVSRDAFNGLPVWIKPYDRRSADTMRFTPNSMYWLAASGNKVITVDDLQAVALDAGTGQVLKKLGKLGETISCKMLYSDDFLVIQNKKELRGIDTLSGEQKWRLAMGECRGTAIAGDRVVTIDTNALIQVDLKSGVEKWRFELNPWGGLSSTLLTKEGLVVASSKKQEDGVTTAHAVSLSDGKSLWHHSYKGAPQGIFFAGHLVWIMKPGEKGEKKWDGLDPVTGEVKKSVSGPGGNTGCTKDDVDSVTDRFFIYRRPMNYLEWETGKAFRFKAVRSGCGIGGVPANGLYYGFPNTCMCLGPAEVRGITAFSPRSPFEPEQEDATSPARLETAESSVSAREPPAGSGSAEDDWPTFRHDAKRSGGASCAVPSEPRQLWEKRVDTQKQPPNLLAGEWRAKPTGEDSLTAPVVSGGLVFVGIADAHQVVACNVTNGAVQWSYTAGGRLDVPPTIYGGKCYFGARDGWVYCLNAGDGKFVWRFRCAPAEKKIAAFGQLESSWPVTGGVLVDNGVVCAVAGRSSALDDGDVRVYGLDPQTGRMLWMEKGDIPDLLVSGGGGIAIGGTYGWYDQKTGKKPAQKKAAMFSQEPSQGSVVGVVMDYSWHYGWVIPRFHVRRFGGVVGQIVIYDDERVFGFRRTKPARAGEITARDRSKPAKDPVLWTLATPGTYSVETLMSAGGLLFAAGPLSGNAEVRGEMWIIDAKDGRKLSSVPLPAEPVSEGVAAAGGRLYVSTRDGRIMCFGK